MNGDPARVPEKSPWEAKGLLTAEGVGKALDFTVRTSRRAFACAHPQIKSPASLSCDVWVCLMQQEQLWLKDVARWLLCLQEGCCVHACNACMSASNLREAFLFGKGSEPL